MNQINEFKQPQPNPFMMRFLEPVNKLFLLKGIPVFRDIPLIKNIPGIRGLTRIRYIDFPQSDRDRLNKITGKNKATFLLPNHPEFFTDWMIDKFVLSKVSPTAVSWASHHIVNGIGKFMQRFWLNNNLVAQIPGQTSEAKQYSINSALNGKAVLLHPEGRVSWYGQHIAPLYCGAGEMAIDTYKKGVGRFNEFTTWLAPIVWKFHFNSDVRKALLNECCYIEKRLQFSTGNHQCPAQRVYQIYLKLAKREYFKLSRIEDEFADMHLIELRDKIISKYTQMLCSSLLINCENSQTVLKQAALWLRHNTSENENHALVKDALETINRWQGLLDCSFSSSEISQEEIADHLKRIRAEFCKGTLRDTLNKYLPQAAGSRTVHIRAVQPVAVHTLMKHSDAVNPVDVMQRIRTAMQSKLDQLHHEIEANHPRINVFNPFYCHQF